MNSMMKTGSTSGLLYENIIKDVQEYVKDNYAEQLAERIDSDQGHVYLREIIRQYINSKNYANSAEEAEKLSERIYQDLAGNSFLSKYVKQDKFEEINLNAWNCSRVNIGGKIKVPNESFMSPKNAQDVIQRILSRSGQTMNEATPGTHANLSENIRIAALQYPIIEKDVGVVASIRRVNPDAISEEQLIQSKSATEEIIEFLRFCLRHNVSICFAGATFSGKTTTANWLLSGIPNYKRIIAIEEGSREFKSLIKYDNNGRQINDFVSLLASPSKNSEDNFDLVRLINDYALWMNPDYIIVGEMKSYEAFAVQEAARTGHTTITTIHSNSAEKTYHRMMTLAQRYPGINLNEDTLMQLMVEAFPIIVYMKKCDDGQRRIMEVMEGEAFTKESGLKSRSIYRFCVDNNERKKDEVIIHGEHRHINGISEQLQKILLDNGASKETIEKYL